MKHMNEDFQLGYISYYTNTYIKKSGTDIFYKVIIGPYFKNANSS